MIFDDVNGYTIAWLSAHWSRSSVVHRGALSILRSCTQGVAYHAADRGVVIWTGRGYVTQAGLQITLLGVVWHGPMDCVSIWSTL